MRALLKVERLSKRFPVAGRRGAQLHAVDDVDFHLGAGQSLGLVGESGCGKSTLVRVLARLLDTPEGRIFFEGVDLAAVPAAGFARLPQRAAIQMVFQDPADSLNPRYTARETIAEPIALLDRLRAELGLSYLFVSHDLNVVRLLTDFVAVMYLGKIVEQGPSEAVFRQPLPRSAGPLPPRGPAADRQPAGRGLPLRADLTAIAARAGTVTPARVHLADQALRLLKTHIEQSKAEVRKITPATRHEARLR